MDAHLANASHDAVALIRLFEPDRLRQRLRAPEAERQALLVLLRAALTVSRPEREAAGRA